MKKLMLLAALLLCSGLLFAQTKEELAEQKAAQKAQQEQVKAEQKAAEKAKKDHANKLKKRKEKAVPIFRNGVSIGGYRRWVAAWQSDTKSYVKNQKIDGVKFVRLYSSSVFILGPYIVPPRLIIDVILVNEKDLSITYFFEFAHWSDIKQRTEGKKSVATMQMRFDKGPKFETIIQANVAGGRANSFYVKQIAYPWKEGSQHSFDYLLFNTDSQELLLEWTPTFFKSDTGLLRDGTLATTSIPLQASKKSVIAAIDYLMADLGIDAPPGEQILADYIAGQEKEILGGK